MSLQLSAQRKLKYHKKYYIGYVITNYGDTIHGRIKEDQNFNKFVKFIPDSDTLEKSVRIYIKDITTLKMNLMIFEKVTVKGKLFMFEKVAYGYYDLFAYTYQRGDLQENRYLLKLPEQTIKIEPRNFKEIMEMYLFDCPEIRQKVIARQVNFEDVIGIFRTYNLWKAAHM